MIWKLAAYFRDRMSYDILSFRLRRVTRWIAPAPYRGLLLGSVGYDNGTILWHFLPITHFLMWGTRPHALRQDFESYFQDGMSYDIPSFPIILR